MLNSCTFVTTQISVTIYHVGNGNHLTIVNSA